MLLVSLALTACGTSHPSEALIVGSWELEVLAVDERLALAMTGRSSVFPTVRPDGELGGRAPCNDLSGEWSYDGLLEMSLTMSSAVECVDADGGDSIMETERMVLSALFDSGPFELRREEATLEMRADGLVLKWRSVAP